MGEGYLLTKTASAAAPASSPVVTNLVRAARVLQLALPVVDLSDEEEHHMRRLARYLIAEAERPRPDEQRIQLLGTLLRTQLQQGPAAATLGAVLADSFDEALNGPAENAEQRAATPYYGRRRPAAPRRPVTSGRSRTARQDLRSS